MGIQFLINIFLSVAMLIVGCKFSQNTKDKRIKIVAGIIFFLLSLPSLIVLIVPVFIVPVWIVELKAVKWIELITVFVGLFTGFIINEIKAKNNGIWDKYKKYFYMISLLILIPQYINYFPILVNYEGFKDDWRDGVCMQSENFTCAPSCMATVYGYFGEKRTEAEMAKALYTSRSGTSLSQILRYAREQGIKVNCKVSKDLKGISAPAILDVEVIGIGHVVVYLGMNGDKIIIGDPLEGKIEMSKDQLLNKYKFEGVLLEFTQI